MTRTSVQLIKEAKKISPKLRHTWFFDRSYFVPRLTDMEGMVNKIKICTIQTPHGEQVSIEDFWNEGDVWDCDDFSALATALVRIINKQQGMTLPLPFGRAMGNEFRGVPILHSLNICFTQEGVYFIDFDDGGRIWKADSENDSIFFVSV